MKQLRGNIMLIITAFIWGSAFVAQDIAAKVVEPFTFNALRSYVGGIFLIPIILLFGFIDKKNNTPAPSGTKKELITGGVACGCALAIASAFQQIGISMGASTGKAGFITAMYILLVPILGLFLGKKVNFTTWISILLGVIGLYRLCITGETGETGGSFTLLQSDIFLILCAIGFSCHILVIDKFSQNVNCIAMSCIQFFTCAVINTVLMFVFENPDIKNILSAILPILYVGVMSSGIAYTLQIIAQKDTNPVVASLLMSLESVFALICGWAILGDSMTLREISGCVLVFMGIILSQIPIGELKKIKK